MGLGRDFYDATWGRLFASMYERLMADTEEAGMRDRRRELLAGARGRTVELGAGTGLNFAHYPEAVDELILTEPFPPMAGRLRERTGDAATVIEAPADRLPIPDASVDTVVSTYSLCTVADPAAVLREARRVLVPGGRLVLVEHGPARTWWIRTVQRLINPFARRWQADDLLRAPRPLAEAAGFTIREADQDGVGGLAHRVSAEAPR